MKYLLTLLALGLSSIATIQIKSNSFLQVLSDTLQDTSNTDTNTTNDEVPKPVTFIDDDYDENLPISDNIVKSEE